MLDSWEYELAKELKSRDNKIHIGPCIGIVTSLDPVRIAIQNGEYMLEADQIYVCHQILERWTTFRNFITIDGGATMSGTILHPDKKHGFITKDSTLRCDQGQIHLEEVWKINDMVLVVPAEDEQTFFIVDILRRIPSYVTT